MGRHIWQNVVKSTKQRPISFSCPLLLLPKKRMAGHLSINKDFNETLSETQNKLPILLLEKGYKSRCKEMIYCCGWRDLDSKQLPSHYTKCEIRAECWNWVFYENLSHSCNCQDQMRVCMYVPAVQHRRGGSPVEAIASHPCVQTHMHAHIRSHTLTAIVCVCVCVFPWVWCLYEEGGVREVGPLEWVYRRSRWLLAQLSHSYHAAWWPEGTTATATPNTAIGWRAVAFILPLADPL